MSKSHITHYTDKKKIRSWLLNFFNTINTNLSVHIYQVETQPVKMYDKKKVQISSKVIGLVFLTDD